MVGEQLMMLSYKDYSLAVSAHSVNAPGDEGGIHHGLSMRHNLVGLAGNRACCQNCSKAVCQPQASAVRYGIVFALI